jgi:hypothetical protein
VSNGSGNDANNCDRVTPCATFQVAHDKTTPGGEINCVDSGHLQLTNTITISKSITIDCGGSFGGIQTFCVGCCAFTMNTDGISVRIRNLSMQGFGIGGAGICVFGAINALVLENSTIYGFNSPTANGAGQGIAFRPTSGTAQLLISDSTIEGNGAFDGTGGGGIFVKPVGAASVRAVIDRSRVESNILGIVIDGTNSSGRTVAHINGSLIAVNNANGVTVNNAGTVMHRTSVKANGGNGILAGPGALIHLGSSSVTGNAFAGFAYNGGQILSYQNNEVMGNSIDNAPSGVLVLK